MFLPLHDQNPIRHVTFPFVTYALIAVNVIVFLIQLSVPSFEEFAITFAAIPAQAWQGTPIDRFPGLPDELSLLTYQFFHADWLHLLGNMLFLWVFGDNIEDALGHVKFLAFYLLCGVLAALAYFALSGSSGGWLIGASGSVAAVLGAYMLLYPHARLLVLFRLVVPIPLPRFPAFWMLAFWLGSQLFYIVIGSQEPVAFWAHVGGFVAGMALAVPFKRKEVPLFGGR